MARAVGLVSEMPSGPGVISERLIREIATTVPPGIASFLLTSRTSVGAIIEQQRRVQADTIQICDQLTHGSYEQLKEALPGVSLVQVVHVTGEESIADAVAVASYVDAVLLDSGNRRLPVKELGGTGRRHDWHISRRIRESVPVPIFLAGGLRAENVAEAISVVEPYALDICSGVRTGEQLDEVKLGAFMRAVDTAAQRYAAP